VTTIVVGVEDSFRAEDAVALARDLAAATGAGLLAVCAYPFDDRPSAHYNLALRENLREAAERTLDEVCQPPIERVAVADPVPARALVRAARESGAILIVAGSSHGEFTGRVHPGSTGWNLLQGAPCAVALAPQGYRMWAAPGFGRVTAAFDGSPGGHDAVAAAAEIARATGRQLRVLTVFGPAEPRFARLDPDAEREARAALERVARGIEGAQVALVPGDPARELARESELTDLLVMGSRDYGPEGAVVLGDIGGAVVRTAACPVLTLPRGVGLGTCGKVLIDSAA
jgi:nucleotide-binding universal stress UspA family protein